MAATSSSVAADAREVEEPRVEFPLLEQRRDVDAALACDATQSGLEGVGNGSARGDGGFGLRGGRARGWHRGGSASGRSGQSQAVPLVRATDLVPLVKEKPQLPYNQFYQDLRYNSIQIDGQDIRAVTIESLRRAIGVVPQDTVLFNDTIFQNINYGRLSATEEEVYNAARHAAIHDTIMNFPQKYSTLVGERGLKLSGGEKQRVALARAFLKAPAILLCDEATSALDSTTETEILNALKSLANNRTSIFIAHRLTTAMQCDEIIVLENGKVVEQGPHEVLLSKSGRYAQLWSQQNTTVDVIDSATNLEA